MPWCKLHLKYFRQCICSLECIFDILSLLCDILPMRNYKESILSRCVQTPDQGAFVACKRICADPTKLWTQTSMAYLDGKNCHAQKLAKI
uniref:Chemokine interleukin-8-like domain-containing protein n=1 Tax=Hippocampus comes TaxID=109280 RepID=A0A3Q3D2H6_HIPCM